jgi:hypothetical protein
MSVRIRARLKRPVTLAVATAAIAAATGASASASTIYDAVPSPLPPNVASLGYEATSTSEFGDNVVFGGTNRRLTTVTVTMSDWALQSDYPGVGTAAGWTHPITLNVYAADHSGPTPAAGSLLATTTRTVTVPWRPAADPTCSGGTAWRASNGSCYNGLAFNVTFDLSSPSVTLPNEVVFGVAYNTEHYGSPPIGAPGPYNSLNVGIPSLDVPTTGSDANPDAIFWNSLAAGFYADDGAGGTGVFRQDTEWAPNGTVAAQFSASPPVVGPPANKDQCKNGGWQTFNNPTFKNQGDCVSYASNGK